MKYLNNVVEQDHWAIKRRTRAMLGFKDFDCARVILSGIEVVHMNRRTNSSASSVMVLLRVYDISSPHAVVRWH